VTRGVAVALVAVLLATASAPGAARAFAAGCDTLAYLDDVHAADQAAASNDTVVALARVRSAESISTEAALSLAPVVADLSATPPDVADARARLDALDRTLALPSGSACTAGDAAVRDALRHVYASPAFSDLDRSSQPSLLEQIVNAIHDFVGRAAASLGIAGGALVLALLVAIVAGLTFWRLRAAGAIRARRVTLGEELQRSTDPDDEWRAAVGAAERRDYREAIRRAFRSALLDTMQRGRLHVDPAWTTRELLASAAGDADLVAQLAPAASLFDRAWYSRATVDEDDWQLMRSRCESVRRLATRRPREQPV